uniref:Uncharacterized protein n=1 Tax=Oryza brachyantha TaxID=4533 RepID=J3LXX7_ORYBR
MLEGIVLLPSFVLSLPQIQINELIPLPCIFFSNQRLVEEMGRLLASLGKLVASQPHQLVHGSARQLQRTTEPNAPMDLFCDELATAFSLAWN